MQQSGSIRAIKLFFHFICNTTTSRGWSSQGTRQPASTNANMCSNTPIFLAAGVCFGLVVDRKLAHSALWSLGFIHTTSLVPT